MENELTLRDKLALSTPEEYIPKLDGMEKVSYMADKLGLEWGEDEIQIIDFSFKYRATMMYRYADALIEVRNKKIKQ